VKEDTISQPSSNILLKNPSSLRHIDRLIVAVTILGLGAILVIQVGAVTDLVAVQSSMQNELLLTVSAISMVILTAAASYALIHLSAAPIKRQLLSDLRSILPASLCILIVVILLWLPFGFKFTGILEEWIVRAFIEGTPSLAFSRELIIRPFEMLPHYLANWITPDSFVGFNIVHAALFWAKGILFFVLIRRLTNNAALSLAAGILFILYPANDGLMTLRTMHVHAAVLYYLIAVYFLLEHWRQPRRATLLAIWAALILSLGTYEAGLALIMLTPLLLIFVANRIDRAVILATLGWTIAPALHLSRLLFLYADGVEFYLRSEVDALSRAPQIDEMFSAGLAAMKQVFWVGWRTGFEQLHVDLYLALGIIAAIVVGATIWLYLPTKPVRGLDLRRSATLLMIAIIAIGLGFVIFLPTLYRNDTWRLHFFTPIGAALFFVVISDVLRQNIPWPSLKNWLFTAFISILTLLAVVRLLNQQQSFVDVAHAQQRFLASVVEQVPAIKPNERPSFVFIIPPAPGFLEQHLLAELFINTVGYSALSYLYHGQVHAILLCLETNPALTCGFNSEALHYEVYDYAYDDLIIFAVEDDGTATLLERIPADYLVQPQLAYAPAPFANYVPTHLIDATVDYSPRMQAILDGVAN